ncbi:hypothetical protein [Natronobacterium gregoryi]|nr:hypothetical protein [Natronobacterium gregoryi]
MRVRARFVARVVDPGSAGDVTLARRHLIRIGVVLEQSSVDQRRQVTVDERRVDAIDRLLGHVRSVVVPSRAATARASSAAVSDRSASPSTETAASRRGSASVRNAASSLSLEASVRPVILERNSAD